MDHLGTLFDRALGDEPSSPSSPSGLAREAMTSGRRLRRRRRLVMGGGAAAAVTAVATAITVGLSPTPTSPPAQRTPISLAMAAVACAEVRFATDSAAVFLRADVTDQQRDALHQRLRSDNRVRAVRYVSKAAAYDQFARMYQDAPDVVNAVRVEQMPELFDVRLALPSGHAAFVDEVEGWPGVERVSGAGCPEPTKDTE